jgi:hypothetical protein
MIRTQRSKRRMLTIQAVWFRRRRRRLYEAGIMINNDQLIIDMDGNDVAADELKDYRLVPSELCVKLYEPAEISNESPRSDGSR